MRRALHVLAILVLTLLFGLVASVIFAQQPGAMRCAIVHPITTGTLNIAGQTRPVVLAYFHRGVGDSLVVPSLPDALYCMRVPRHLDTIPHG